MNKDRHSLATFYFKSTTISNFCRPVAICFAVTELRYLLLVLFIIIMVLFSPLNDPSNKTIQLLNLQSFIYINHMIQVYGLDTSLDLYQNHDFFSLKMNILNITNENCWKCPLFLAAEKVSVKRCSSRRVLF